MIFLSFLLTHGVQINFFLFSVLRLHPSPLDGLIALLFTLLFDSAVDCLVSYAQLHHSPMNSKRNCASSSYHETDSAESFSLAIHGVVFFLLATLDTYRGVDGP
jgi:hypothetical protein